MISYPIQQSTATQPLVFMMVQSADHITPATGLTVTVTIRKPGGSFAAPSGAVSEIGSGWYQVAGHATDSNTLGPLILHATATGADPCDVVYPVVAYNPLASSNLGLSALPTAAPGGIGGLPVGDDAGKVTAKLAAGDVTGNLPANVVQIAGQTTSAAAGVTFPATVASTTNITSATGVTLATSQTFSTSGSVGSVAGNVQLDLTQAVPTSNTAQTVGDALNAARAQGFGKWVLSGTALNLYAADGTTVVRSFTLDDAADPTSRS